LITSSVLLLGNGLANASPGPNSINDKRFLPRSTVPTKAPAAFLSFCSRQPSACLSREISDHNHLQSEILKRLRASLFDQTSNDALATGALENSDLLVHYVNYSNHFIVNESGYLSQKSNWMGLNVQEATAPQTPMPLDNDQILHSPITISAPVDHKKSLIN
jgi:hypothetical protein